MVILNISVDTHSNKRNELLSTFRFLVDTTSQEKGCLGGRIYQDIDNQNLINLEETWERRSYLDEYFRSDIFSALLGAIKLLGASHEIRISDNVQTEGMEAVNNAKRKNTSLKYDDSN